MSKIPKFTKRFLPILLFWGIAVLFLMLPGWLSGDSHYSEYYAKNIFPYLSLPIVFLSSLVPVSITEIVAVSSVLASPALITWYIVHMVRAFRAREKSRFFYRSAVVLSVVVFLFSASFTIMHGMNYSRKPLESTLRLIPRERSADDLAEVMTWLVEGVSTYRPVLPENESGGMLPIGGIPELLTEASHAMDQAAEVFPELSGNAVKAKPVALSHYWSYTGIVGMYCPFLGEANVNIDVPASSIPLTVCHEIAHVRGIAREQDANLAGFLACMYSDRADFKYSGYRFALIYISEDLYATNPDEYYRIAQKIPSGVIRDSEIASAYWKSFEGPVEVISTELNDAYLKVNLQEEGVHSYSLVSQLIIEYYFNYIKGAAD